MTKTQYYTATSLDGYIADADNSLTWLFEVDSDAGGPPEFSEFFAEVAVMCMGATTYQWVLDQEDLLAKPDKWREYYGDMPCWVFTHRDLPAIPGADIRIVSGDVVPIHRAMVQAAAGKNIWLLGGGDLVGQFADRGLVDELRLSVAPVTLGSGAPVLPRRILASNLRLAAVTRHGQIIHSVYELGSGPGSAE